MTTVTQEPQTIDFGGGILHRQEGFTVEVAPLGDRWGLDCTACDGWWSDVDGEPITAHSRSRAEQLLSQHNRFEHRESA